MPTLTVSRDSGWVDRFRDYQVLVDGNDLGKVGNGETIQLDVEPGRHVLRAQIDFCGSREVPLEVGDGGAKVLLRSALRGWRFCVAPLYIAFNRDGYVLAEVDGEQ